VRAATAEPGAEPGDTLAALIAACSRSDQTALRRLYDLEGGRLYGIALRIVRRPAVATDVVQDAFLQIWQKAASFDPAKGNAEAWLVTIVRYRALDAVRRNAREVLTDDPTLGDDRIDATPDALSLLEGRRDGARLRACLETLEEINRRSIVLAFVDGLSHSEIADRLATPLGTVKAWIRRGLASLKTCLET